MGPTCDKTDLCWQPCRYVSCFRVRSGENWRRGRTWQATVLTLGVVGRALGSVAHWSDGRARLDVTASRCHLSASPCFAPACWWDVSSVAGSSSSSGKGNGEAEIYLILR